MFLGFGLLVGLVVEATDCQRDEEQENYDEGIQDRFFIEETKCIFDM